MVRVETAPGAQLQIDSCEKRVVIGGTEIRVFLLVAVSASRRLRAPRSRAIRRYRVRRICAFSHVRERFVNQSGCDAKTLSDERVKHGLECVEHRQFSRLDEHTKCSPYSEPTRLGHVPSDAFVDEKQIRPKRLGEEDRCRFSWVEPEI
jgi:hypothetical protein